MTCQHMPTACLRPRLPRKHFLSCFKCRDQRCTNLDHSLGASFVQSRIQKRHCNPQAVVAPIFVPRKSLHLGMHLIHQATARHTPRMKIARSGKTQALAHVNAGNQNQHEPIEMSTSRAARIRCKRLGVHACKVRGVCKVREIGFHKAALANQTLIRAGSATCKLASTIQICMEI